MRRFVILPIAALMLAGCGAASADDPSSNHGTYEIDAATGETTATITTEKGTLRINSGVSVAADIPGGWTLYPGARVVTATNASAGEGKSTMVTFTSEDDPGKIAAFYHDQAVKNALTIEMEMQTGDSHMLAGANGAGTKISVFSRLQVDETVAQLSISENFGN